MRSHTKVKRLNIYTTMVLLSFCLAGCMKPPHQEPYLENRSAGWKPSVLFRDSYNIVRETDDPFYQSFIFSGSDISKSSPKYLDLEEDTSTIMERALKEAFHDRYIDCGSMVVRVKSNEAYHVLLLSGGETFAIIDKKTGMIVQCVDTRIQEQCAVRDLDGYVYVTVDLAKLSDDEVKQLSTFARGFSDEEMPQPFVSPKDCPLNATKAFEITSKNLYALYSYGKWEYIGDGQYIIYDAESSNSWLIIGKYFTMLLDKDTGEKKFFSVVKDGFEDKSKMEQANAASATEPGESDRHGKLYCHPRAWFFK